MLTPWPSAAEEAWPSHSPSPHLAFHLLTRIPQRVLSFLPEPPEGPSEPGSGHSDDIATFYLSCGTCPPWREPETNPMLPILFPPSTPWGIPFVMSLKAPGRDTLDWAARSMSGQLHNPLPGVMQCATPVTQFPHLCASYVHRCSAYPLGWPTHLGWGWGIDTCWPPVR